MELIYQDKDIIVCVKPSGVLSTDEPGGLPELLRQELGDPNANVRTVHRLDRTVSGLMVLARRSKAAATMLRHIWCVRRWRTVPRCCTICRATKRDALPRPMC